MQVYSLLLTTTRLAAIASLMLFIVTRGLSTRDIAIQASCSVKRFCSTNCLAPLVKVINDMFRPHDNVVAVLFCFSCFSRQARWNRNEV
jgi:hypothetical protein